MSTLQFQSNPPPQATPAQLQTAFLFGFRLQQWAHYTELATWQSVTGTGFALLRVDPNGLRSIRLARRFLNRIEGYVRLLLKQQSNEESETRRILNRLRTYCQSVPTQDYCEWVWDELEYANNAIDDGVLSTRRQEVGESVCGEIKCEVDRTISEFESLEPWIQLGRRLAQQIYPTASWENLSRPNIPLASTADSPAITSGTIEWGTPRRAAISRDQPTRPQWPFWEIERPLFRVARQELRQRFLDLGLSMPEDFQNSLTLRSVRLLLQSALLQLNGTESRGFGSGIETASSRPTVSQSPVPPNNNVVPREARQVIEPVFLDLQFIQEGPGYFVRRAGGELIRMKSKAAWKFCCNLRRRSETVRQEL